MEKICLLIFLGLVWLGSPVFAQDYLSGDWGGTRSRWGGAGVELGAIYTADYFSVVSGGVRQEGALLANLDLTASFDGDKLFKWPGASFFLYILADHGHHQNGGLGQQAGDFQGVSNIEAPNAIKIYEAWYEQKFANDAASFRFGLYDLNSEFDVIETAGLFINSSFGIGPDYSQSGQNGPSIFPTTSVALRLAYQTAKNYYLQLAVLDGVPGDPNNDQGTHIQFNAGDGLLTSAEYGYQQGGTDDVASPYGKLAVGVWHYTASFDDLLDTNASGNPVKRHNNQGAYVLGEFQVYREHANSPQGLAVFARYGVANQNINRISHYLGAGLVYTGLFAGRDKDQLGLAVAIAYNGDKYIQKQWNSGTAVDASETTVELSYRSTVLPWLTLQPDIQWIKNPGTNQTLRDATVIGLRGKVVF